jgi:hypothetical protein
MNEIHGLFHAINGNPWSFKGIVDEDMPWKV